MIDAALLRFSEAFSTAVGVLSDNQAAAALAQELQGFPCRVESGAEGQVLAATWPEADLIVAALVGFSGFEPVLAALTAGKRVALANKESLVVGGELLAAKGLLKQELIIRWTAKCAIRQCLGAPPDQVY